MSLRIAEIFGPTIQGEGSLIGTPSVFVRAGGCDYRCSWCDTPHAVDSAYRQDWTAMTAEAVWQEVLGLSEGRPILVTLTGGNPAIQDFAPLLALGKPQGYGFACETQGSVAAPWFADLDTLVLSPKPPSSGETVTWDAFDACVAAADGRPHVIVKIVIFDAADYAWAKEVAARYAGLPLVLQPGNPDVEPGQPVDLTALATRLRWLMEAVADDGWFAVRVLPQLHVLAWGNRRGV